MEMEEPRLILKKGREKPVLQRHPWIFSGAVKELEGDPGPGGTVLITDHHGKFLARGAYSPHSQIRARVWSLDEGEEIGPEFIRERLAAALNYRSQIGYDYPMRRLVHAESDLFPGLIVDQYGEYLVIQVLSAGVEAWKGEIIQALVDLAAPRGIYERSDVEVRKLEGLEERRELVYGELPEEYIEIEQEGSRHWIDVRSGHKTGYYLDQRLNRRLIGQLCAGRSVLDCFCYSGGFSLEALRNGARSVTLVDESADALALAERHLAGNQLSSKDVEFQQGDVFSVLREMRDRGRSYDVVILDPPKFAPTASLAQRAARGYKDINLYGFKLLKSGGLLASFSCSGGISRDFFLRILSGAALDAGVNARIQLHMGQSADHSANLSFPEGMYLKGFGIRVDKEEVGDG